MTENYILTIVKPYFAKYNKEIFNIFSEIGEIKTNIALLRPSLTKWETHYKNHIGKINKEGVEYFYPMTKDFANKNTALAIFKGNIEDFVILKKDLRNIYGFHSNLFHRNPVHTSDSKKSADKEIIIWEKDIEKILLNNDFKDYFNNIIKKNNYLI